MTGANFYAYCLRLGFKRTDKETEFYEACTDAVEEMRRRFPFDGSKEESVITDTITALGDFKIAVDADFGLLSGVVMEDDETANPLIPVSKDEFDTLYPDINVTADRGYPKHCCIFAGQVYIGPIPDSTSYVYRMTFSLAGTTIVTGTAAVPFTDFYRDVLADNVMARLYKGLEEYDKAAQHEGAFEKGFLLATRRERNNSKVGTFMVLPVDC